MNNSMKLISVFAIATVGMITTAILVPASMAGGIIGSIMSLAFLTVLINVCYNLY